MKAFNMWKIIFLLITCLSLFDVMLCNNSTTPASNSNTTVVSNGTASTLNVTGNGTSPGPTSPLPPPTTTVDPVEVNCRRIIQTYTIRRQAYRIPAACHRFLQLRNVTVTEVIDYLKNTSSTVEAIHQLIRSPSFPSDKINELIAALSNETSTINDKLFTTAIEAIVDKKHNFRVPRSLQLNDVNYLQDLVMYVPAYIVSKMSTGAIDFMLSTIHNYTGPNKHANILKDPMRHGALCNRVFSTRQSLLVNDVDKLSFLLNCAPAPVCASLSANDTTAKRQTLLSVPWHKSCAFNSLSNTEQEQLSKHNLRGFINRGFGCGREIAKKLTEEGTFNASLWSDVAELAPLFSCFSHQTVKKVFNSVDCATAEQGLISGNFTKPTGILKSVVNRCVLPTIHPSNITCSQLGNYSEMLTSFPASFIRALPSAVICDNNCQSLIFGQIGSSRMPAAVKNMVLKKCMPTGPLNTATVGRLRGMVVKLPISSVMTLTASDLGSVINDVKSSLKTEMKKDPRKRAILRNIAKKLTEAGSITSIVDNRDFMKQLSFKDLQSVQNISSLYAGNANPNLPDSQNKFFMKKVLQTKVIENMTASDVSEMKSLVKGLLSREIARFNPSHRMEIATALCQQSNWPMKPLRAINRQLIVGSLEDRMSTDPMSVFSAIDVDVLGCECLVHFKPSELRAMSQEACQATCTAIGACSKFQCLNPEHRRGILSECLHCTNLTSVSSLTLEDISTLGPHLVQQFSPDVFTSRIPQNIIEDAVSYFQGGCLPMDLRAALKTKILAGIGATSTFTSTTFESLLELVMIFSDSDRSNMNMNALSEITSKILEVLNPDDDTSLEYNKCCQRWMSDSDKAELKTSLRGLYSTIMSAKRAAMTSNSTLSRRKRSTVTWTCSEIQSVGPAFIDATVADIEAIADAEFSSCISDLGGLSGWSTDQINALYARTKQIYGNDSCSFTSDNIVDLGNIAIGMSTTDIACLNLTSDDAVIALGSQSAWSSAQITALANTYKSFRNASAAEFSSSDLTNMKHILCGFATSELTSLNASSVGGSGSQLGAMSPNVCSVSHFQTLATIAEEPTAYGPIWFWDASVVSEMGFLVVGLTGNNMANLSTSAVEGLSVNAISHIPNSVLSAMSVTQLQSFSSAQAASVTSAQKSAMTMDQRNVVATAALGDFAVIEIITTTATPPSSGSDEAPPEKLHLVLSVIMGFLCLCLFLPLS